MSRKLRLEQEQAALPILDLRKGWFGNTTSSLVRVKDMSKMSYLNNVDSSHTCEDLDGNASVIRQSSDQSACSGS